MFSLTGIVLSNFDWYPFSNKSGAECRVSIGRIQKFLEIPELPVTKKDTQNEIDTGSALSFQDVTCMWDPNRKVSAEKELGDDSQSDGGGVVALDSINVELKKNELTFVIGPVGCGKSAFLYAAAGELVAHQGCIARNHQSIAFAPQDPWIMNGSVKENILMGLPYEESSYEEVVKSCGLDVDFCQFVNGDETIVGDR